MLPHLNPLLVARILLEPLFSTAVIVLPHLGPLLVARILLGPLFATASRWTTADLSQRVP